MKSFVSLIFVLSVVVCGARAQSVASVNRPRQAHVIPGQTPTSPKLEEYFQRWGNEVGTPDGDGFVRNWLLLEPISKPNRTNTVFVDSYLREVFGQRYFERQWSVTPGRMPKDRQIEKIAGEKRRWHALQSKMYNNKLFRFASGLKTHVYGVLFWVCTTIECDADLANVRLSVGSNSASMWWIDGEEALLLSGDRRMVMDDAASRLMTLTKGRHVIWGAVINGPGMSDFCLRFVDEKGDAVRGFKVVNR